MPICDSYINNVIGEYLIIIMAVVAGPNPFAGTVEIEFQAEEGTASTANVVRPWVKSSSVVEFVTCRTGD